ncbi:MAG: ABC transporter permease, partial [Gemmatimonadota bacterium]
DGVLFEPLPYPDADRVVRVWNEWEGSPRAQLSPAEYFDYRERVEAFEAFGVYAASSFNLTGGDEPERVRGAFVSAGVFDVFGIEPALGRVYGAAEDRPGQDDVVVLSHGLWRRGFGGSPDVLGRTITLDGTARTVIGVMPASFRLDDAYAAGESDDLFVPLGIDRTTFPNRGSHFLSGVARLAPGVDVAGGGAAVDAVAQEFVAEYPDEYPAGMRFGASVQTMREAVLGPVKPMLYALLGAVGLVLLIVCANVASLLLARSDARRREFGIRAALGAGRGRLARQLLVESVLLAGVGGVLGVALAAWGTDALLALQPGELPRVEQVGIDLRVLGFAAAAALATGLLFGALPALRAGSVRVHEALKEAGRSAAGDGRSRRPSRQLLIVAEVALAVVLLLGAGLLIRSFQRLQAVDPGFTTENVLTVRTSLPEATYPDEPDVVTFYDRLLNRVEGLPGVREVGAVSGLPLATTRGDLNFMVEGRPVPEAAAAPAADWQVVTPGYFESIGMRVLRGRGILPTDRAEAPGAVVINETMAETFWPDEDPLGQRIMLGGGAGPEWPTVVGIVADVRHNGLAAAPRPEMYLPHAQFRLWGSGDAIAGMTLTVRTETDPASLSAAVRREVRALDPELPLAAFRTMDEVFAASVADRRFAMTLLALFAATALLLAAVGIYGIMAYAVTRRRREIGLRIALGARAADVAGMVVRQAGTLAAAGIAAGLLLGLGATRLLSSMLYEISPTDPATVGGAAVVLAAVSLLAGYLPARRASRTDPMVVLREE